MGKAKAVKKTSPAKPLKISTSLFKRRLSKNSTGQLDKETVPKGKKVAITSAPSKGVKRKVEPNHPPSTTRRRSSSPLPKKVGKKKPLTPSSPPSSSTKKGKAALASKKKEKQVVVVQKKGGKSKASSSSGTPAARRKEESLSPLKTGRGRWSSNSSSSSASESSKLEKVTKRKTSKSDDVEPEEVQHSSDEEISEESGSGSESASGSGSEETESDDKKTKKKPLPKMRKKKVVVKKSTGKKMVKKSVLASKKKKFPVKGKAVSSTASTNLKKTKSKASSPPSSSSSDEKSSSTKGKKSVVKSKQKEKQSNKGKDAKSSVKNTKLKPRPKHKRMASLNAKAILEASFSFENQEKRQRSPAPSSATSAKIKEEEVKSSKTSVSTCSVYVSTSPPPALTQQKSVPHTSNNTFIPIQNQKSGKVLGGERKRTSSEGRRESINSNSANSNHIISTSNNSSRRNSLDKKSNSSSVGQKKKGKVLTTTSTSTGTSPPPNSGDFGEERPKQKKVKKSKGVDSSTCTGAGREVGRNQDSSVQANQFKSAGNQSKERKSSSSVAQFGTVYQPAGPLIEPHKTSSVPAGLLPETVKLPPDLKVTYQTHPPSSNPSTVSHSSPQSSSKSRKHAAPSTSSTTTTSSSSSSSHHKDRSGSAGGQILHQPYKSASAGASASSSSAGRQVYSSGTTGSGSYMNLNASTATGSPLLISQQSATSSLNLPHPGHHSISSGAQSQAASAGAPSAGGLFYSSTGFTPHHSPFAPNKYPMVPPESYRTHSPYQNSYLYPSTTPQQSQYFMTPFYTPPLTPNSNPLISGGLGTMVGVGAGQVRPMSLHHPSIAAASFYPQSAPQPGGMGIHPSSYLVASPHHSLQPAPTAPGHAGLFPLNPCTQPACPTESCPPSSTNNNKQQPQQSAFNALPQDHQEGALGAKPAKALSTNTPRPIRPNKHPLATAPTIAAVDTPPITIQLITSNQNSQARQLESAKTFTEQYSLPDDITITPIIVNNASALLLKNTSISIVNPPTSSPKSINSTVPVGKGSPGTNKKKERDIVHVIDPRSGHKTTIAKHISNRNLLAKCNINKNLKNTNFTPNATTTTTTATTTIHANKMKPNVKKLGATGVSKLNPDLDVIVIQNNGNADCDEMSITENLAHNIASNKKSPQQVNSGKKLSKKSLAGMTAAAHAVVVGVKGGKNKRVVVTVNENVKNSSQMNLQNSPVNYSLPPGISVSSGSPTYNHNQGLNLSTKARVHNNNSQNHNDSNFVQVQAVNSFAQQQEQQKGKKRITLNDCIDGLQKKRLKLLEEHNLLDVHSGASGVTYNGIANNVIPKTSTPHNFARLPPLSLSSRNGSLSSFGSGRGKYSDSSYSSARVRDTQILRGCTVIQSCDAEAAVSAVVEDHETYFRKKARLSSSNNNNKGIKLKNGFNKGNNKFHSKKTHPFLPQQTFVVGMSKVKSNNSKGMDNKRYSSQRNTRSTAANAKIRTRFSANKPKGDATTNANSNPGPPRNRSRLLRGGGGGAGSGAGNLRGDSDSSTNNSRSNSAVRIINGHTSTGLGLGKSDRENKKFPTQAFINAVADLYQYRRNVLLRVPLSGVGVFPSASSINLSSLNLSSRSSQSPGEKTTTQQLSPSIPFLNVPIVASATASLSSAEPTCSSVANHVGLGPPVKQPVGSMAANAAKKRAVIKPLSPSAINGALIQMGLAVRRTPKWSNGWRFEGEPYETKVYLNNDDQSVLRRCYPAMRHEGGDVIQTRDCVLLKSGSKKNDLPFIAKIAALWENPADGEMMFSLLWYYRPEHTEMGRTKEDMPDEIFASKHIDANSVATIDDRCYVLTFNEYCRYRKRLKQLQESLPNKPLLSLLSETAMINNNASAKIAGAVWSGRLAESEPIRTPSGKISPEVVFFCRKVYDFRQKRIMKNPS